MATGRLGYLSLPHGRFHRPLQYERRHMVPPFDATAGVD
jgi:hypothetical protein